MRELGTALTSELYRAIIVCFCVFLSRPTDHSRLVKVLLPDKDRKSQRMH